ncbi:unnamed protein product [Amaranthus hypochondriacus]
MEMYKNMKICVLMAVLLLAATIQIIPPAMATGRQKMWSENGKFSDDVCVPKWERCGPKQDGRFCCPPYKCSSDYYGRCSVFIHEFSFI